MILLAIDSSNTQVGLALYEEAQVLSELIWHSHFHHTVELAPALSELLARCAVKIDEIRAIGVALGPGSFTCLRVGLALAKGLVLARQLPLIGIPTLDILAANLPICDLPLAAVIQAGRGRIAVGWYQANKKSWQVKNPVELTTVEELIKTMIKPAIICGEITKNERALLARQCKNVILTSPAQSVRRPGALAEISWQRWQEGKIDTAATLKPIYLQVASGSLL